MPALSALGRSAARLGKPAWRPMLAYTAELHGRSIHPPVACLPEAWEEIGPGYCYGPAFGHWDIVHQIIDVVADEPEHAARQLRNDWHNQQPDGLLPGSLWIKPEHFGHAFATDHGHPPVWPVAVDRLPADPALRSQAVAVLARQVAWFDNHRAAQPFGYFYTDILDRSWESGIDEGVRFDAAPAGPMTCVDASAHLHLCLDALARWTGEPQWRTRATALAERIRDDLYCEASGCFHDSWSADDPSLRVVSHETIWPLVSGAASQAQADTVIARLEDPATLGTAHPIATVARNDPRYQARMWRGPAWNSITWWAAEACLRYGHRTTARKLLERALDHSAQWFATTGHIWEFYDADGGDPRRLIRKPHAAQQGPCPDYLGHNPLVAMARLWDSLAGC